MENAQLPHRRDKDLASLIVSHQASSPTMVVVCRASFQDNYDGSPGQDPPSKVRKASIDSSNGIKEEGSLVVTAREDAHDAITPLGFGYHDFLPLDHSKGKRFEKKRNQRLNLDLNTLSDDTLGMCFFNGFLDTFESARLMLVNKRIHNAGLNQVQHLDLRGCENLTAGHVASIATSLVNLTELDFSYCSQFGGNELNQLVPGSKNLRHLMLKGTNVDDQSVIDYLHQVHTRYGSCSLETLDLSAVIKERSRLIGDAAAKAISIYCPNLKCLRLGWCKNLTDHGVKYLASLPRLSTLDLSLTNITDKACDDLLQIIGPGLEELDLSATNILRSEDPSEKAQVSFSNLQCLATLRLLFCPQLTSALLEHIVQNAVSLKLLDVTHSGPEGFVTILPEQAMDLSSRKIHVKGARFTTASRR